MKKISLLLVIIFSLTFIGSCNESSSSSSLISSSEEISSSSSTGVLKILNVKQYLGYGPIKIPIYVDGVKNDNIDLYFDIIDKEICEIENGFVIGKKIGETLVYASDINGVEVSFIVYIKDPSEFRFATAVNTILESYKLRGKPSNPTLFIGDSFFDNLAFWKTFYEDFSPNQNVFAAGISSSKTTDWLILQEILIYDFNPKNVIIHLGTNDINDSEIILKTEQYYEQITEFLHALCQRLKDTPIYFFGIENRSVSSGYGAKNAYVEKVTEEIKTKFAPLYENFTYIDSPSVFNKDQAKYLSSDRIHPSSGGYKYYVNVLNELVDF